MIDVDVEIEPSFRKKINRSIIKECEAITVKNTTLEAESRCKKICPYDTGALMRGHSTSISPELGTVRNRRDYWVFVVFGTSKMEARNYPQVVVNSLYSENYMSRTFKTQLAKKGVLE